VVLPIDGQDPSNPMKKIEVAPTEESAEGAQ